MKVFVVYGRADDSLIPPLVFTDRDKAFTSMKTSFELTLQDLFEEGDLTPIYYEVGDYTDYKDVGGAILADIYPDSATIRESSGWVEWEIAELEVE